MKARIAQLLRWLRILHFDMLATSRQTFPDVATLKKGEIVVVEDSGIKKWACFLCPGECGANISLSLNPSRRPRWRILLDFWKRPTVEPSVHQKNSCGCHFFLKAGKVEWCDGGPPRQR